MAPHCDHTVLLGPVVLYGSYVSVLLVNFFLYPAMLLTGRRSQEDVWRRSGLLCMCLTIVLDLIWTNFHPRPLPIRTVAVAATVAATAQLLHLLLAFGHAEQQLEYTLGLAATMQFVTLLPWVFVNQVGTAYVVRSNRSPARYQILAWLSVMVVGSLVTMLPELRETTGFTLLVATLPRAAVAAALGCSAWRSVHDAQARRVGGGTSAKGEAHPEGVADDLSVALPRAARFAMFACNGTVGEALNDMATDLKIRAALSAGDTQLTLSYNAAVFLSMLGGLVSEALASGEGARCLFAALWGICQVGRGLGMSLLTPDRTRLMFAFVFVDKFTGPLGQAAIDTALLALMRREGGGSGPPSWPRVPANAVWTLRTAAERLERPLCQLLLLQLGLANAPAWLPLVFAMLAMGFVFCTLRPNKDEEGHQKVE